MKEIAKIFIGFLLAIAPGFMGCRQASPPERAHSYAPVYSDFIDTVACSIVSTVDSIKLTDPYHNGKMQYKTKMFYRANHYKKAWLGPNGAYKRYLAFANEVSLSGQYGLSPEQYHMTGLNLQVDALYDNPMRTEAEISWMDIRITASFFLFTTHLIEGRVRDPGLGRFIWQRSTTPQNDVALLLTMRSETDVRKGIQSLQPDDSQYRRLQGILADYIALQRADTLPVVSENLRIRPGETHDQIPLIRRKIELRGGEKLEGSALYDTDLLKCVMRFQERHGLAADGIIGPETIRQLNVPLKEKAEQIALHLERMRWGPHTAGTHDKVIINIPEYMLRVYRNDQVKLEMKVVVGAEATPTPVFCDTVKYIVFSPAWLVPRSIFANEFFPKLRENPSHFNPQRFTFYRNGSEIDPIAEPWSDESLNETLYYVIEKPGPGNSLGDVKFIMPNKFSVYLHDTPSTRLFRREKRAGSHGCIRLERPEAFARYLLDGQKKWDGQSIDEAMRSGNSLKVDVEKEIPVHIVYRTVWVDEEGAVHFRDDIYGHDKRHLALLRAQKELLLTKKHPNAIAMQGLRPFHRGYPSQGLRPFHRGYPSAYLHSDTGKR